MLHGVKVADEGAAVFRAGALALRALQLIAFVLKQLLHFHVALVTVHGQLLAHELDVHVDVLVESIVIKRDAHDLVTRDRLSLARSRGLATRQNYLNALLDILVQLAQIVVLLHSHLQLVLELLVRVHTILEAVLQNNGHPQLVDDAGDFGASRLKCLEAFADLFGLALVHQSQLRLVLSKKGFHELMVVGFLFEWSSSRCWLDYGAAQRRWHRLCLTW